MMLERNRILVWFASLVADGATVGHSRMELSADERARADRFQDADVCRRFIVAHAFQRRVLAACARVEATSLCFGFDAWRKPWLLSRPEVRFNLSHSADIAILAVRMDHDVGVDIEECAQEAAIEDVAKHAFSRAECHALEALSPAARRDAFFRMWTRKEAYVKALGRGLSWPTRSFSVSHLPNNEDALLTDDNDADAPRNWRVTDIRAPDGFHAALAAPGREWSLSIEQPIQLGRSIIARTSPTAR
jgi:4'-phosphopantetheinyl transferase